MALTQTTKNSGQPANANRKSRPAPYAYYSFSSSSYAVNFIPRIHSLILISVATAVSCHLDELLASVPCSSPTSPPDKMSTLWLSLSKLLIISILLQGLVFCQEQDAATTDNETTESEEATDPPSEMPRISTQPLTIQVQVHERVVLPCQLENQDQSNSVPAWTHNGAYLSNGPIKMSKKPTIALDKKTNTLTIKKVVESDAGFYTCLALSGLQPEVNVTHHVVIVYPPSVDLQPADSPVDVLEGGTFGLTCLAGGFPAPGIKWVLTSSSGERTELGQYTNQTTIEVPSMSRAETGTYTCVANNGIGEPANDSVVVHIRYKPQLLDSTATFLSRIGGEARLECSFSAYPLEGHTLNWYRLPLKTETAESGDEKTEPDTSGKEDIVSEGRNAIHTEAKDTKLTSTLTIKGVEADDFRKYICVAGNELGTTEHTIELSGLALPIELQSTEQRNGLHWTIKSASPIKRYEIIYREVNETHEGEAHNITLLEDEKDIPTDSGDIKTYKKTHFLENLRHARNYSVIVVALNEYGWSHKMPPHRFSLDDVRKAHASGLSGKGGGNGILNSHSSLLIVSALAVLISRRVCGN
ncbi:putative Neurotrimin [Hypsibius exemplaris]|uniref:Neurotrimin n=1 Tax=Hypsibius exemplaris TaxID=2072580 RepID=A0A1W0X7J4_HYPEX|nr:putative Neurotrimin [Hypsibius exemplaris]